MIQPEVVLLDLGNVLISIDPEAFSRTLRLDRDRDDRYRNEVLDVVRQYESGAIDTPEWLARMARIFDGRYTHDELTQAMLNVIGKPVAGMEELVERISGSVALGLVSNTNELHFRHCLSLFPALKSFQHFFLSYRLHCMKPEERYYALVLEKLQVDPARVFFVDDLMENVEGAQAAGMQAFRFVSAEALWKALTALLSRPPRLE